MLVSAHYNDNFTDIPRVLDTFADVWSGWFNRAKFPLHAFLHRTMDIFDENILEAYHMAIDDPESFALLIGGKVTYEQAKIRGSITETDTFAELLSLEE